MKRLLFFNACVIIILFAGNAGAQVILPVRNLHVDYDLSASWDAPRVTLLTQDFEGSIFPPTGWQMLTENAVGWFTSEDGSSQYFVVPGHTRYAISNDDTLGPAGNSCCDYLVTPALDLTVCQGFKLSFDSYFNGNNGQKATLEMSTDNGTTWNPLEEMNHYPAWKTISIDLTAYSGAGGLANVMFAFHADDQGNQASGWAVDNVVIYSDSLGVTGYSLYLDQTLLGTTPLTTYEITYAVAPCGQDYEFCVNANYSAGQNADTCTVFTSSTAMFIPTNFQSVSSDTGLLFSWEPPLNVFNLYGYNLYDDSIPLLIVTLPPDQTSYFLPLEFGNACLAVTSIMGLDSCGMPGMTGESIKAVTCDFVHTGFDLPFTENFSSGTLTLNKWSAGNNWSITGQVGNAAPSVKYEGGKSPGSYSSALTSWYFNSLGYDDCPTIVGSILDFEIKLNDVAATGTEQLIVELVTDNGVTELKRYKNDGSFDWLMEEIDITLKVLDYNFQVRFRTEGENSQNISAWYIDNIGLYNYISDSWGSFLTVTAKRQGSPENDIKLTWDNNYYGNAELDYILDDGTAEYWYSGNVPGPLWKGNKFLVTETGVLQKASVLCSDLPSPSASCTIDIFNENGDFLGSSAPFTPLNNVFTDVYLPDIPFSGPFYAMYHVNSIESSNSLGVDANGPNSSADLSWVYDGTAWYRLVDYTSTGGVFMIRVSAFVGDTVPGSVNPCDVIGYNIYRRDYAVFPAGPNNSGTGTYGWIGSVPFGTNEYTDRNLSNNLYNCYEYKVTELFSEGEGGGSSAWDCIYVSTKGSEEVGVNIYPNPANETARLELSPEIKSISVFNPAGQQIYTATITNQSTISINTSYYLPGIYSIRFTTTKGDSFIRKLVVVH